MLSSVVDNYPSSVYVLHTFFPVSSQSSSYCTVNSGFFDHLGNSLPLIAHESTYRSNYVAMSLARRRKALFLSPPFRGIFPIISESPPTVEGHDQPYKGPHHDPFITSITGNA